METMEQPVYGNWISDRRIQSTFIAAVLFAVPAAAAFVAAGAWGAWMIIPGAVLALFAALMLAAGIYFVRARQMFSPAGGNVQNQIVALVTDKVDWDGSGRALDIGCGSGVLTVALAKKYPDARITGVDYWGGAWEYQRDQGVHNAALEGVDDRTEFIQASASKLPFEDGVFDLAVSNMVFHEVRDVSDKRACIKEGLRVIKPGGVFVFQDLLQLKLYFGTPGELISRIKSWGVREVHFEDTSKSAFIPRALMLPFMVGTLGMVWGVK